MLILLVEDKGGKTQYLIEEISLFYYPGDNQSQVFTHMMILEMFMQR